MVSKKNELDEELDSSAEALHDVAGNSTLRSRAAGGSRTKRVAKAENKAIVAEDTKAK